MQRSWSWAWGLIILLGCAPTVSAEDDPGFRPLFDGKTLTGWTGDSQFWSVADGAIVAESTPEKPCKTNTFLVWNQGEVDDFVLRLQFRLTSPNEAAANAGVQFRSQQKDDGHMAGYQADIDLAGKWVGACYDEEGRGMLAHRGESVVVQKDGTLKKSPLASAEELLKSVRKGDWNEYEITAKGSKITLKLNGTVTAEIDDQQTDKRDMTGLLGLQLHSGPPQKVEYKNIRLKRLPLSDGRKKVVFFAGRPSHAPREHEHNAGCLLLAGKLDEAAGNGLPVVTTVYRNGWPKDPTALDNANTVIFYCDGGVNHFANDRLEEFDALAAKGVGLCCIHYGVEVPKGRSGDHFLKWIGGYFEPHWSVNPHWTAHFKTFPNHPIAKGVKPFEVNDEWYYHMRFQPDMKGVTPILTDLPSRESLSRLDGPHSGNPFVREAVLERKEPQHVAWAYDRPDGKGRGFGFTGAHYHKNWQDDNFRKVVLNAIVWTAGLEVPEQGVETTSPTDDDLQQNLDPKGNARKKPANPGPSPAAAVKGDKNTRPVTSTPVISTATAGHVAQIDADITGAKELYLVVSDGADGFACDWADWIEPTLTGPSGKKKLSELKWDFARSDWGETRVDRNAAGGPLVVSGKPVSFGIGTHANSVIKYTLPEGFTRFTARGGIDVGGSQQGNASTIRFHVFTQAPPAAFLSGAGGASHDASDAVSQLTTPGDLQVTLFASEPLLLNPTNIEVDHLGRVWACEVVNYRNFRNTDQPERKEGDRIVILEDTNGDGQLDHQRTFYQGRDVDSAHGILLLPTPDGKGTRALISCGDSVFYLIDDDGDLKADRKELLFTGISGVQHDHGIHAAVMGPDGRLYFNFGNEAKQIRDKNGQPIIDRQGHEVTVGPHYREGMVFRCNPDGSEFETLGWNFRNNWELAVDSYGTIWQSDNDDDGNRGVRLNEVIEFGNYGYTNELTGASWRTPRTNLEADLPQRHWHQNDPGVIPNLIHLGNGSPTGICRYEGTLLPARYHGALFHCDAGTNAVTAYPLTRNGAGYSATALPLLSNPTNKWFRPTDVCVAPDGSLIISDWYDAGVGGHAMRDIDHGRLFRVAPAGTPYRAASYDLGNPNGAMAALQSPNQAWRYLGWQALKAMGPKAEAVLMKTFTTAPSLTRARSLWLLGLIDLPAEKRLAILKSGLQDTDPLIRITTLRVMRAIHTRTDLTSLLPVINLEDPDPLVRRELLIGLRDVRSRDLPEVWARLASQYQTGDRWSLEVLGIAADGHWDECLEAWLKRIDGKWNTPAGRDIVWRSRANQTATLLADAIGDPDTVTDELPRYFRALDFQKAPESAIASLVLRPISGDANRTGLIRSEAFKRISAEALKKTPELKAALDKSLDSLKGTAQYIALVIQFGLTERMADLLNIAIEQPGSQQGVEALLAVIESPSSFLLTEQLLKPDWDRNEALLKTLAATNSGKAGDLLLKLATRTEETPPGIRRAALTALAGTRNGLKQIADLAKSKKYLPEVESTIAAILHAAPDASLQELARKQFPLPDTRDSKPLPSLSELAAKKGDVVNGRVIFHTSGTCTQCHTVNGLGKDIGPNLSEIGSKLSRTALLESILYPSAGISHNYETAIVITPEGSIVSGIVVTRTDTEITLKDAKGITRTWKKDELEDLKFPGISLMPADLQKLMTEAELIDVVEYMTTLKKAEK